MSVHQRRHDALVRKVRLVLSNGLNVAIIGWKESNHSDETREMAKTERIRFYWEIPKEVGPSFGLILWAKFVGHAHPPKLARYAKIHPTVIPNGRIKSVLAECKDLIVRIVVPVTAETVFGTPVGGTPTIIVPNIKPSDVVPIAEPLAHLETSIVDENPQGEETEMDKGDMDSVVADQTPTEKPDIDKFKRLFLQAVDEEDGLVGKKALGDIRRQCGMTNWSNASLVLKGWVEAVVGEGRTKAGRYKPSQKLWEEFKEESSSARVTIGKDDPLYAVYALIASEESVRQDQGRVIAELAAKQIELEQINITLQRINKAKETLENLRALAK